MKTITLSGIFQALVGTGMIAFWMLAYVRGGIPELETEIFRISMHMMAELCTAILLLLSAFYILLKKQLKGSIFYFSMGALIYTLIASPGYFAQLDQWGIVSLFLVMLAISTALLVAQEKEV